MRAVISTRWSFDEAFDTPLMAPLVVLVGPPGAGKSSVGRALASRYNTSFRDTDADVEMTTGMKVSDVFLELGEEQFRALESAAVETALAQHDGVLALGGGAILDARTRQLLQDHRVVYLEVDLADATKRVGFNRDRPLLLGNPRAQLHALMEARRTFYEDVATLVVVSTGKSVATVAAEVAAQLK